MGFHPTHLDSHMGTLFASPAFLEKYVRLGTEKQIPVMLPGGHDSYIQADLRAGEAQLAAMRKLGEQLWAADSPYSMTSTTRATAGNLPPEAPATRGRSENGGRRNTWRPSVI